MRCACCDKVLEESEVKYNKLFKKWDYCGMCKAISREILQDIELLDNHFFLDNDLIPVYNIGVEDNDT